MTDRKLAFVSFEPSDGGFLAASPFEDLMRNEGDYEEQLARAARLYADSIARIRAALKQILTARKNGSRTSARSVWQVGDAIYRLTFVLSEESFQVDGLYEHLVRDLGVARKWLEKAVILRRYINSPDAIPESLNWGRIEKGTRRAAERISQGLPAD